jgi:sialic acid synthase SpsE
MNSTYLIGEIGQNHNGSVDIARLLIDLVCRGVEGFGIDSMLPGMNAIKLTKRDLNAELSQSMYDRPYEGPNSFGKTYGQHREFLELSDAQHHELQHYAKEKGLEFVETLCGLGCLSLLDRFLPDRIKVASRDLTNLPLLDAIAAAKIPVILSTGMADKADLDRALSTITRHHENISILHCVSEYPTKPHNVNLATIKYLIAQYPNFTIGYSDHTIGISTPVCAVAMGARIIEKHITIDRRMKGTDQAGSLGPDGVYRMVRDIRMLELSLGVEDLFVCKDISETRKKLERSVATRRDLLRGHIITELDIHLLSPGDGVSWIERGSLVGRAINRDIPANEIIYPDFID